ncbi:NADP-dependent oxidoreductase [Dactylosporangium vinaceum]|uniref:NADP-dependent oxidoreductase n=1 Tax=Dactylosporangium vinaceum TaxID=53362 RepID=A0ABV5M2F6_9ACTN|nr:NADP-dependent oxidoreductase [Dactylosporangium vinaceum]
MTDARAVRFDTFGGPEVLYVTSIPMPSPGPGEVVVAVRAAGINPGESGIRTGSLEFRYTTSFPCGEGSDLAGVVTAVGPGVTAFAVGDEVLGFSWTRSSHATHTAVPVTQLIPKPPALSWEVAGALYVVACTAFAAVRAIAAEPGETVAVSAAAGGVGTLTVQLLRHRGVRVLGIASPSNRDWLEAHGAVQVSYGPDLAARLRAAAPDGIDAFIDLFGPQYVDLALELGIPKDRINTIIAFQAAERLGVMAEGSEQASTVDVLTYMAGLVADGTLEIPIAATYPLDDVAKAFAELDHRHTRGKIVLVPAP